MWMVLAIVGAMRSATTGVVIVAALKAGCSMMSGAGVIA